MNTELKATCVWGEGPNDVMISIPRLEVHGPLVNNGRYAEDCGIAKGYLDLTAQEARALAWQLSAAADHAEQLDKMTGEAVAAPTPDTGIGIAWAVPRKT